MKKVLSKVIKYVIGNELAQRFFSQVFLISLKGMNYGNSGNFKLSGELEVLHYIKEKLTGHSERVIFDVGANVGNYSRCLHEIFDANTIIHAFEPSQRTFEQFLETTSGIKNIIPKNIGFSDIASTSSLHTNAPASELASLYKRNLLRVGILMDEIEEISLSTIDAYCQENFINRIHFLKLDIEGHELKVLQGASHMLLASNIDFIQFEFGGCNIDSRTYFRDFYLLLSDRYKIYRVLANGLFEIKQYEETQEIFTTVNYLAERKL